MCKFFLFSLSAVGLLSAQESLNSAEKEVLLSKIESLETTVIEVHQKTQVSAVEVFDEALQSEEKTYELFEYCRKKVYFEDEKREDRDARENEKRMDDVLSDEFKRALVHQLYFLRHSLEAGHYPERRMVVAKRLVDGLGKIVKDEDELNYEMVFNKEIPGYAVKSDKIRQRNSKARAQKGYLGGKVFSPLYQDPFQSVFAKAYKVDHLRPEGWMQYPMDFNGLYKDVILADLIESKEFSAAREQWDNRLKGEAVLHQYYGLEPSEKGDTPASYDKYMELKMPELQWDAEHLFFSEGDEKEAATALFNLLQEHKEHPKYLSWVEAFKEALK